MMGPFGFFGASLTILTILGLASPWWLFLSIFLMLIDDMGD